MFCWHVLVGNGPGKGLLCGITHLLVDALEINEPVGDVFGVTDIVGGDFKLATSALQDAVDKVTQSTCIINLVFFEPLMRDSLRGLTGAENIGYLPC